MSLFRWIGKLCGSSQARAPRRHRSVENNPMSPSSSMPLRRTLRMERSDKIDLRNVIKSSVKKEDILVCEYTPKKNREETRFRCSICYTFYSDILECSECSNYVCIFDVEKFIISVNQPTCPFCSSSPVVFRDVTKDINMVKHYFSSTEKSEESKNDVREYWKSHARVTNSIKFVAINDTRNVNGGMATNEKLKIMALDHERQTITPMCMKEVSNNLRQETEEDDVRRGLFQTPINKKKISKDKIRKRLSRGVGHQIIPSLHLSSKEGSNYFKPENNDHLKFISSGEDQETYSKGCYPAVLESATSEEVSNKLVSTIVKDKEEIVSLHTHNSLLMGSSIKSTPDHDNLIREERKSEMYSDTNPHQNYPRVLSSKDSHYEETENIQESSNYSGSSQTEFLADNPKITAMIEVIPKRQSNDQSSRKDHPDLYKYQSYRGTKDDPYDVLNMDIGETIISGSGQIPFQSPKPRALSEDSVKGDLPKITNVKNQVEFQKSGIQLNKRTKCSLYNKLSKRGINKFARSTSRKLVPKKRFANSSSSKRLNMKNTKLSSIRRSTRSFNPFRERMMFNYKNKNKQSIQRIPPSSGEVLVQDNVENEDLNISGSDYSKNHVVSKYLNSRTKAHGELNYDEKRPIMTGHSSRLRQLNTNPDSKRDTGVNTSSLKKKILMESQGVNLRLTNARETGMINTISSSTAVVNKIPQMQIQEHYKASPVRGSESSSCNYKSTRKIIGVSQKKNMKVGKVKRKNFRQDGREYPSRRRLR
ncbi:unnamed protein product [Moneuplotes crassus]|uniref:Uncharacterized protein n=1 Tax=Euplotes crassus TaxID=5936 RepID=A0AAD2DAG4_EUPCR|nr:unnamed protein product [Moneuplotes crassus]